MPLATAISSRHNLELTLIRDMQKEYGTKKLIEAHIPTRKDKIAIVDDVFTTGASLKGAIKTLEISEVSEGKIVQCCVIVKRGEGELKYPWSYLINLEELL